VDRHGWHLAHKIGDLVRIKISQNNTHEANGALGVVVARPEDIQKSLFIKVYIFKNNREQWLAPSEIDTISNIDE
jgi:hypothetical protein